jgi:ribosomal protein L40E
MPLAAVAWSVNTQVAQSVHTGFAATMMSAAALFGLVLIALTFGYRAAVDRVENMGDFRHFGVWMWSSGLTCCVYYAYCMLIPAHLMVTDYSKARLVVWIIASCIFILAGHIIETRSLFRMGHEDWSAFKRVFTAQTTTVVIVLASFLTLNLYAVSRATKISMFDELLVALAFTLVLASIRAVLLVATSFYAIMLLYTYEQDQKTCGFCGKRVPMQAVKCPYCHSTLEEQS